MKKSELRQLIKEEIKNILEEKIYSVEYWYRSRDDEDIDTLQISAGSEEEAIEKAKLEARKSAIKNTFKIISNKSTLKEVDELRQDFLKNIKNKVILK